MPKAVRLSDIAKRVNVSTVTVSKALTGQKGVSESMRAEIVELAEKMGYVKNSTAARVPGNSSHTLGVIVAERYLNENQSFYWSLYQEISQRALQKNCFTMLEVISYADEKEKQLPKILSENKAEGLIIMGAFKTDYALFLNREVQVPKINLDTPGVNDSSDSVVSNNMMGGYLMTNYLFGLGHRKIGFVGTRLATARSDDRYLGYLKSLMEHGVKPREEWLIDDRDREYGKVDYEQYFRLPSGMPTAFFCNCDLSASLLIRKLQEAGYNVPKDISVAGFDNYLNEQIINVGITTYEINTREMANRAVHILTRKLENANYSTGMFMLAGKFIERNSAVRIGPPVPLA